MNPRNPSTGMARIAHTGISARKLAIAGGEEIVAAVEHCVSSRAPACLQRSSAWWRRVRAARIADDGDSGARARPSPPPRSANRTDAGDRMAAPTANPRPRIRRARSETAGKTVEPITTARVDTKKPGDESGGPAPKPKHELTIPILRLPTPEEVSRTAGAWGRSSRPSRSALERRLPCVRQPTPEPTPGPAFRTQEPPQAPPVVDAGGERRSR